MAELSSEKRQEIMEEIFAGRKISAIKLYREATGLGLKEAKDFVEVLTDRLREEEPDRFTSQPTNAGCTVSSILVAFCLGVCGALLAFLKSL